MHAEKYEKKNCIAHQKKKKKWWRLMHVKSKGQKKMGIFQQGGGVNTLLLQIILHVL